jgi:two-component system response regulator VanR
VKHVLLVDDEEVSQKLAFYVLAQNPDLKIFTAFNTDEADEILKMVEIDLILLDIFMPRKDGLIYSLELKTAKIPIVFLTGSESDKDEATAYKLGAEAFIPKPCGEEEIAAFKKKIEGILS